MWDPHTYLKYGDERARPFVDLVARIGADSPSSVVDLGCGPGNLTAWLAGHWPGARISGIDSSAEMIARARAVGSTVDFSLGDVRQWRPDSTVDVVISNATLQWVPDHDRLLIDWVRGLRPGGWLAVQVPGNFNAPSHQALRLVAAAPRWRDRLETLIRSPADVLEPAGYAALLLAAGATVDAWETTYLHLLGSTGSGGEHPVLSWMEGTALRPIRAALTDPAEWNAFRAQLAAQLTAAYPAHNGVVPFAFRRIFFTAQSRRS